ncbi:hypothetical protein FRB93_003025 [Tulasnella sp. JGI-2019a]|nr:hypothetical protein FRB93_003025 [Tulasnella sp. JGI-2019a]
MAIPILCGSSVLSVEMQDLRRSLKGPLPVAGYIGSALKTCGSQIQRFEVGYLINYYNTFIPDFSQFVHLAVVHLRNLSRDG